MWTDNIEVLKKLIVPNPKYIEAIRMQRSVRFTPKDIPIFHPYLEKKKIVAGDIPQALGLGLAPSKVASGINIPGINGSLAMDQLKVVNEMLQNRYSYGNISTGVGKTWIISEIISRLQQHTLIVVHSTSALTQMQQDIKDILSIDPHIIGKKKHSNSPIHIINIHSMDKADIQSYGLIIYDEADKYLVSNNYRKLLCQASSHYQYAVTGTTMIKGYPDDMFRWFYGQAYSLIRLNLTPSYIQVPSKFKNLSFESFSDLSSKLYADEERNKFIASVAKKAIANYNKGIIFCRGVEHSKVLSGLLEGLGFKTFIIIGEISNEKREQIRQELIAYEGKCFLIGSVQCIGRGFNVPELDLGILTSAEKFEANIMQFIGRIVRVHPGKTQCLFIDIVDNNSTIFASQARARKKTFNSHFKTNGSNN